MNMVTVKRHSRKTKKGITTVRKHNREISKKVPYTKKLTINELIGIHPASKELTPLMMYYRSKKKEMYKLNCELVDAEDNNDSEKVKNVEKQILALRKDTQIDKINELDKVIRKYKDFLKEERNYKLFILPSMFGEVPRADGKFYKLKLKTGDIRWMHPLKTNMFNYEDAHTHYLGNHIQWVMIDPKDFEKLAADISTPQERQDSFKYFEEQVAKGGELWIPNLQINTHTGQVLAHEGRHRNLFAARRGIEKVPLAIIHRKNRTHYARENMIPVRSLDDLTKEGTKR